MGNHKRIHLLVDLVKLAFIILISCVLVSVIIFAVSEEPWIAISSFFLGPFSSMRRIGNIIEALSPLIFTALAVIIIFQAGQFSLIAEGSFFIGITGAMVIAVVCELPGAVHPAAAIVFGGLCGAAAASIPAFLKLRWKVSELVTSIMLNYVVTFFSIYLVSYHLREPNSSSLASLKFRETSRLPVIVEGTRIHAGTVLGLVLCVLVWFFLHETSLGTKLRITGDNPLFAKYAGLKVTGLMAAAQIIAGAIAGIGGGAELLGMYSRFKWTASPGYGWTGIVVALLARQNPLLVPLAAAFIGYLNVGADIMARNSDVGSDVVGIIQGVMMFLIAADALFNGWRQRMIVKAVQMEEREVMQS